MKWLILLGLVFAIVLLSGCTSNNLQNATNNNESINQFDSNTIIKAGEVPSILQSQIYNELRFQMLNAKVLMLQHNQFCLTVDEKQAREDCIKINKDSFKKQTKYMADSCSEYSKSLSKKYEITDGSQLCYDMATSMSIE